MTKRKQQGPHMESSLHSTEKLDDMFLSGNIVTEIDEERLRDMLDGKAELSDVSVKDTFGSWKFYGVPGEFGVTGIEYSDNMWLLYTDLTGQGPLSADGEKSDLTVLFKYRWDDQENFETISAIKGETPSYVLGGHEDRPVQGKLPDDFLSSVQFLSRFKDQFRTAVGRTLNSEITFKGFLEELSGILS